MTRNVRRPVVSYYITFLLNTKKFDLLSKLSVNSSSLALSDIYASFETYVYIKFLYTHTKNNEESPFHTSAAGFKAWK